MFEPLEADAGKKCCGSNKDESSKNAAVVMPNQEEVGFDQQNQDEDRRRSTVDVNKIEGSEQGKEPVALDEEMIGI